MIPTKEQERKALEQIKKILKGLGNNPDNSYVCRAFDGCVEDAESNIENDFGDSYKSRYEYRKAECEGYEKDLEKASARVKELERKAEEATKKLEFAEQTANEWIDKCTVEKEKNEVAQRETNKDNEELRRKVEAQDLEILKLKAKLYDLMVGAA